MTTVFNVAKMDLFIRKDRFLLFQFTKTMKQSPDDYNRTLKQVFNTYILGNSVMEHKYNEGEKSG